MMIGVWRSAFCRLLQDAWQRMPLSVRLRFALKGLAFRVFAPWIRETSAYRNWLEQQQWQARYGGYSRKQLARRCIAVAGRVGGGMEVSDAPMVSIIVPVCNRPDLTSACLAAIADYTPKVPFEIVVVEDAGDDLQPLLEMHGDLRYVRGSGPAGFAGSCNRGATEARGRYVVFLSNNIRVLDGWLDSSVSIASRISDTGVVCSKLIFPNARIKECEAIGESAGRTGRHVKGRDARTPGVNFVRDVGCCSGGAILVSRALFEEIGGFDLLFTSSEGATKDLCFTARDRGYRVIYQPLSEVVQCLGDLSDWKCRCSTDSDLNRDLERFRSKWTRTIGKGTRISSDLTCIDADQRSRPRMLVIDACTPMPDRDSGSIDLINYLRLLDSFGYRVTFFPVDLLYAGPYTRDLQGAGVECLYAPFERSVEGLLRARGAEFDAVMLMRQAQGSRYLKHVRALCPRAKVIFNSVDLHFLREERRALTQTGVANSPDSCRLKRLELDVIRAADSTIVISRVERELLAQEVPAARIHVIPLLREIPGRCQGYRDRQGILFIGGFRHPPNSDAIIWFCERIWPIVRRKLPNIELTIVGSYPSPEILRLEGGGIRVLGYVEEIEPLFACVRISIAPLRYGAGLKGKVVTSLSYGVPCVVTPTAAEGLELDDHEGILVASEPEAFAESIARLYEDGAEWERVSQAGLREVARRFSLEANRPRLAALLGELGLPYEEPIAKTFQAVEQCRDHSFVARR